MQLTYAAKTPDEFKGLCLWMREEGFTKNGAASPTVNDKGAYEAQYVAQTGGRMRLTNEEKGQMALGKTREDIAQARLVVIAPQEGGDDQDVLA